MRWDDRRLEDRIRAEARSRQIDLSKWIPVREAANLMGCHLSTVMNRFDWLEGVTLCGRHFVKRDRAEWLDKFRKGRLTSDDQMGESLAPFDVAAARAENERKKREEEEERRRKAEAERPKGFHIDGKIWWDYDNNDTWVPTRYAVNTFDQTLTSLYDLAKRGRIRRRWADARTYQPVDDPSGWWPVNRKAEGEKGSGGEGETRPSDQSSVISDQQTTQRRKRARRLVSMWSLRDIERFLERRDSRGRRRGFSFDDPGHPFTPTRVYTLEHAAHERKLISRKEAAEILGMSESGVTDLVTEGRVKAYQNIPHRPGSKVWFSEDNVLEYANKPDRLARRERYWKMRMAKDMGTWEKQYRKPYHPEFGGPFIYDCNRSLKKSHGEYYTVKQAAAMLDCTKGNVLAKIRYGVLKGCKTNTDDPNAKWNRRRWWFIRKDELHRYLRSPEYRRRRAAWLNHHAGPKR